MPDYEPEKFPPIKNIDFKAKQKWPDGEPITKIQTRFTTAEDMQLMILNIFVHDFGHDFNFYGYMSRILSNIKELERLGINISNQFIKKIVSQLPFGERKVFMYNDTKFKNVPDEASGASPSFASYLRKKQAFNVNERQFERIIESHGGAQSVPGQSQLRTVSSILDKKIPDDATIPSPSQTEDIIAPEERYGPQDIAQGPEEKIELEVEPESLDEEFVVQVPILKELTEEQIRILTEGRYFELYANAADFLSMYETLKLYPVAFLGPNYYTDLIPESADENEDAFYKYYTHFQIITAFYGLICYYDDFVAQKLYDNEKEALITSLFSNLLTILLASYLTAVNERGANYFLGDGSEDPLLILNSKEVLNVFNNFFIKYVSSNDEEFNNFKEAIMNQVQIEQDEGLEGGGIEDEGVEAIKAVGLPHLKPLDIDSRPKIVKEGVAELEEAISGFEPLKPLDFTKKILVKREYGIFHNNLLATITRGIFLKTGIWQKIFELQIEQQGVIPDFTQDNISSITKGLLESKFTNKLLIAEILVVKHMLLEILPDFLHLAKDIDDKLRTFLEIYLSDCDKKIQGLPAPEENEEDLAVREEYQARPDDEIEPLEILEDEEEEPELEGAIYGGGKDGEETGGEEGSGGEEVEADELEEHGEPGGKEERVEEVIVVPLAKIVKEKVPKQLTLEEIEAAYETNLEVVEKLKSSKIPPIALTTGGTIDNLYDLLKMNTIMIARDVPLPVEADGDEPLAPARVFSYPAPHKKFVLDNAATLTRNVNGFKLQESHTLLEGLKVTLPNTTEFNAVRKKFIDAQKFFGLYKSLKRGVLCAGSSMMDAMDNCSLERGATEPKEIGTTNFELVFGEPDDEMYFSYGGAVLYYNGASNINVHIDFSLKTKLPGQEIDEARVKVDELDVANSEDLKARIVYRTVIQRVDELFKRVFKSSEMKATELTDEDLSVTTIRFSEAKKRRLIMIKKMKILWSYLQFNPYSSEHTNFNELLEATGLKNLGDLLQETQATLKWGGYVNSIEGMDPLVQAYIEEKGIRDNIIYRSVSEPDAIIPYDENGNALRFGTEGDRPSAFRAIYILLFSLVGINLLSMASYLYSTRSIIVSRDQSEIEVVASSSQPDCFPFGKVIYVKRPANAEGFTIADPKQKQNPFIVPSKPKPKGKKGKKPAFSELSEEEIKNLSFDERVEYNKKMRKAEEKTQQVELDKMNQKDLKDQMDIGALIPTLTKMRAVKQTAQQVASEALSIGLGTASGKGGKTRKHKKPLKKKTNTRNKNKTKKAKKTKKTIKRRNKIQKKHQKTR